MPRHIIDTGNQSISGTITLTGNLSSNGDILTNRVGIGTTTPNERLTVSGNISASNIVYANGAKLASENFAVAMAIALG